MIIPLLLALATAAPPPACAKLPGLQSALTQRKPKFVVVGEWHGSRQIPWEFANIVCQTRHITGRPVVVAVEQQTSEQNAIDAYIDSNGDVSAISAFRKEPMWSSLDGRGSETQLMLFAELRRMHRRGDVLAVKAFVPAQKAAAAPGANPEDEYNASMASQLLAIDRHYPNATIAVLVGNAHAAKAPIPGMDPPFVPAAGKLPAAEVLSLDVWGEGGQGWTCAQSGCGPHPAPKHPTHPRALVMGDGDIGLFDGVVYLGRPLEASPPANLPAR